MSGRSVLVTAFALVSVFAAAGTSVEAQLTNLIPGVRARIRAPGSVQGRLTGTVVAKTADSLSMATENGLRVQLPLSMLTAVEISQGKSRSKGAMKGALWGGGVGMLSGLFSDSSADADVSRGEVFAAGVLAGVMSGALIGALVQSERWERLEVPVRTALIRTHGGPTAVVSISF